LEEKSIMLKHRWSLVAGVAAFGWFVSASLGAEQRQLSGREVVEKVPDLDIGYYIPGEPRRGAESGTAAAAGGICEQIGEFGTDASGAPRFRGNLYRIGAGGAQLREFKMELEYNGNVTLHFAVYRRRASSTVYDRVYAVVVPNALGQGNSLFYSSGPIPGGLDLDEGTDYAIGVGWGTGISVTFARSAEQQPTNFGGGQVLGLVQANVSPPLADPATLTGPTAIGAYSMQICLEPAPGACCFAGGCDDTLLQSQCVGPGSFFHGQRTVCAETLCRFGACCSPCGGASPCRSNYTPEACEAEQGTHHTGVTCPATGPGLADLCPRITGACCGDTCEETCVLECEGEYLGDGTTCDPNRCVGACCRGDSSDDCVEVPRSFCEVALDGEFQGPARRCILLSPGETCQGGACCTTGGGVTTCVDVDRRTDCMAPGLTNSVYLGDGTVCPANPAMTCPNINTDPDVGGCCLPHGECINTQDQATCESTQIGGAFVPEAANCAGGVCATHHPTGACCFLDGTCDELTEDSCGLVGGFWTQGGEPCSVPACDAAPDIPTGACCTGAGGCAVKREAQCEAEEGQYLGDDEACVANPDSCPGFGACCRGDGGCDEGLTEAVCEARGGAYQGTDSSCFDLDVECDERRACCTSTFECLLLMQAECAKLGGTRHENVTSCDDETCGSCCDAQAVCVEGLESECVGVGTRFTPQVGCKDLDPPCVPAGACCMGDGSCQILLPTDCVASGGAFQGGTTSCPVGGCGSCCVDTVCTDAILSHCEELEGEFHADALCEADLPCEPRGACCVNAPEPCVPDQRVEECADRNGVYQGDASLCDAEVCVRGSCCHINGFCDANRLGSQCMAEGDQFRAGVACGEQGCFVRGACCINGGCEIRTRPDCENEGGAYGGDRTLCSDQEIVTLCTPVACCVAADGGTCAMLARPQCEQQGDFFPPDAATCDTVGDACQRGSCCSLDGQCADGQIVSTCEHPEDFSVDACASRMCMPRGACCVVEAPRCRLVTSAECVDMLQGTYAGDGVDCANAPCTGACCRGDGTCTEVLRKECTLGSFRGGGTTCAEADCCQFVIFHTDPPNCAIDAGRILAGPTDMPARAPWRVIQFEYMCPPEETPSYTVRIVPDGPGPAASNVELVDDTATITLSEPIALKKWTCLVQDETLAEVCFGWLPGDVTGDRFGNVVQERDRLVQHLENPVLFPLPVHSCDANRSNHCYSSDIVDLIDIFIPRTLTTIPGACPTAPTP